MYCHATCAQPLWKHLKSHLYAKRKRTLFGANKTTLLSVVRKKESGVAQSVQRLGHGLEDWASIPGRDNDDGSSLVIV